MSFGAQLAIAAYAITALTLAGYGWLLYRERRRLMDEGPRD